MWTRVAHGPHSGSDKQTGVSREGIKMHSGSEKCAIVSGGKGDVRNTWFRIPGMLRKQLHIHLWGSGAPGAVKVAREVFEVGAIGELDAVLTAMEGFVVGRADNLDAVSMATALQVGEMMVWQEEAGMGRMKTGTSGMGIVVGVADSVLLEGERKWVDA